MREEKLKSFVARILAECEQEGLTVGEVQKIPVILKLAVSDAVSALNKETSFRRITRESETC